MSSVRERSLNSAMAWDRLEPPQRGGDVAQRRALAVEPMRRLEVEELLVHDDDLPQAEGATVFWLERRDGVWVAWAATITEGVAVPWLVTARRIRLIRPDPALLRFLGSVAADASLEGEPRDLEPMPRHLACICREKGTEAVYRAAESGWITVDGVKRRTGVGFGECQGRRCEAVVASRLDLVDEDARARITPRPPLVPVPASVLAAFVGT